MHETNLNNPIISNEQYDIVIVGGGPIGLALAIYLSDTKLNVLVIEKGGIDNLKQPKDDGREVALTYSSLTILEQLGVWQRINPDFISPLKKAQVFNGQNQTPLSFNADKSKLDALGYLVGNYHIRRALYEQALESSVSIQTDTQIEDIVYQDNGYKIILKNQKIWQTKLLIGADSRFSFIRKTIGIPTKMRDFSKTMIVCRMQHKNPHNDIAYEYFFKDNTLALLPLKNNTSSVVITLDNKEAKRVFSLSKQNFNEFVSTQFSHNLGDMLLIGKRFEYPLLSVIADTFIAHRCALVGDAAVGMHPVTAHGFNLGLRGQAILAKEIIKAQQYNKDIGSQSVLKQYQSKQLPLSRLMYYGTNSVVSLFANNNEKLMPLRQFVLNFANKFPPIHYMMTKHLTQKYESFRS